MMTPTPVACLVFDPWLLWVAERGRLREVTDVLDRWEWAGRWWEGVYPRAY